MYNANYPNNTICQQECIPVGCVLSAAVAVSPAKHVPLPCMPPCHIPPGMHAPPPAMDAPLPRMSPCHIHPPATHASLPCTPSATHAPYHTRHPL